MDLPLYTDITSYSCIDGSMLHGSETWPVRKENVVTLQRADIRMVTWMCGVKLKDRLPSKELRERLGIDDIALVLQQNRLCWYGHVLRKEDDDWVKKCMEYSTPSLFVWIFVERGEDNGHGRHRQSRWTPPQPKLTATPSPQAPNITLLQSCVCSMIAVY